MTDWEPVTEPGSSTEPVGGEPRAPSQPATAGRAPEEAEGIRFRDNRRIDPDTFEVRVPTPTAASAGIPGADPLEDPVEDRVTELTKDLQRLSAEYANYRKRVDRDRELQRDLTIIAVLTELLPVLDDVARARDHDELSGGFKAVGESIEGIVGKYGLHSFGEVGEVFDPNVHEAMTSQPSDDVTEPTVGSVYQVGYRIKDRVLRPARVAVLDAP